MREYPCRELWKINKLKAIQIDGYGGPEVLQYRDVPNPQAASGEIVVDIHAASVNPGDIKVRKGQRPEFLKDGFPHTLGRDFSGVVSELGAGVSDFKVGDAVFGILALGKEGAYAERIAVPAELVALKPPALTHVDAVALALTGLSALYALEDSAAVKHGETILIHGGSGGIGTFSVQYCKHRGASVYTTASARNHDYVRQLGADVAIDYHTQDFTHLVPPCDIVFDMIGGDVQKRSLGVLKPGGRIVSIAASVSAIQGVRPDITVLRPVVARDRNHLERIAALAVAGSVRPPPITRMQLNEARAAHELLESGTLRGKIVFEVRG